MSSTKTKTGQPLIEKQRAGLIFRESHRLIGRLFIRIFAIAFVSVCFPLSTFGQDRSSHAEDEIELENPFEQPSADDEEDYSWFGTIMTFPVEPEPFRFSSYSKPSVKPESEIFIEGKVEPAGLPWNNTSRTNRSAVARDSGVEVKLSVTSPTALVDGTEFTIEVENNSGKSQSFPAISLQIPDSMTLISANRVPRVDQANRTVFFQVSELASGTQDTITYRVRTTGAGSQKQTVSISPANRPRIQLELNTNFETR